MSEVMLAADTVGARGFNAIIQIMALKILVLCTSELISLPSRLFTCHVKKTTGWSRPTFGQLRTTSRKASPLPNSFIKNFTFELHWLSSGHGPAYLCNNDCSQ